MTKHLPTLRSSSKQPGSHLFSLRNKRRASTVTIDFTPAKALPWDSQESQLVEYAILPTFNSDGKHYSQAFYTPYEGLDNDSRMKQSHQKRVRELSTMVQEESIVHRAPLS
jgi:hypothetical protein